MHFRPAQRLLRSADRPARRRQPRGFTLIELLVVASVVLLLTVMVVSVFNAGQGTERVRAAARQIQSSLAGARDRAIHAREPRGIRLILDPNDPTVATSLIYIGANATWSQGTIQLGRPGIRFGQGTHTASFPADDNNDGVANGQEDTLRTLRGYGTGWRELYQAGLLQSGARIKVPATGGSWYTVSIDPARLQEVGPDGTAGTSDDFEVLTLTTDHRLAAPTDPQYQWPNIHGYPAFSDYILELLPSVLPNEKPISLPSGVAIDLDYSRIPGDWYQGALPNRTYYPHMDILYSPRGTVVGPLAAQGLLHLVIAESRDTDRNVIPWRLETASTPANDMPQGTSLLLTLFTRTGNVSTHPIDLSPKVPPDGLADDPFRFAETGAVAGK